jgi:hypothetical protein
MTQRYAIEGSYREEELSEQGFRAISREPLQNGMTLVVMERGW